MNDDRLGNLGVLAMEGFSGLKYSNKIGPYLMPTFALIYSHVASSEINEL